MTSVKRRLIDNVAKLSKQREDGVIRQLRRIVHFGKYVVPTRDHRDQLARLEWAIDNNHPAVELIRRMIAGCNEKYLSSIARLFVEHGWEGYRRRSKLEAEYGVGLPSFIVISPLARCNLKCIGCYAGSYGEREPYLTYEEMERLLDESRDWGSRFTVISGGEPMMFWKKIPGDTRGLRDLFEQYDDTVFLMYTNGTLIDDEVAADMAELGNVSPAISVEGFAAETDARRGEGVFDSVVAAMDRLREHEVLFGASVTYTSRNYEVVSSDEFIDFLIDRGCIYAWYFMYIPVGREPDLGLMVTPEQRRVMCQTTWRWVTTKPIFVADFWNSGVFTKGCIAAGRSAGYLHVTHRGDITPCVFMMYSAHNIHDTDSPTPLLDAVRSDFFAKIREGQKQRQHNPLAPCQIVDHPEVLKYAVETTDAHDTQEGQRILTDLHEKVAERARQWSEIADELWTRSGAYVGFRKSYSDNGWLPPG